MSGPAEEHRRVAGAFTVTVEGVAPGAWDRPAPVDGWVARDVVGHMVEWMPAFLEDAPIEIRPGPPVADDPLGAWLALSASLQAGLDGPKVEVPADADEQTRLIACTGRRP